MNSKKLKIIREISQFDISGNPEMLKFIPNKLLIKLLNKLKKLRRVNLI